MARRSTRNIGLSKDEIAAQFLDSDSEENIDQEIRDKIGVSSGSDFSNECPEDLRIEIEKNFDSSSSGEELIQKSPVSF